MGVLKVLTKFRVIIICGHYVLMCSRTSNRFRGIYQGSEFVGSGRLSALFRASNGNPRRERRSVHDARAQASCAAWTTLTRP